MVIDWHVPFCPLWVWPGANLSYVIRTGLSDRRLGQQREAAPGSPGMVLGSVYAGRVRAYH